MALRAVLLTMLAFCLGPGFAAEPVPDPILRIEAGTHAGPIRTLAVDPAERRVVTAGDDGTARVWDLQTQRLVSVLRIPMDGSGDERLYASSISPDGREVAVGGVTGEREHRIYFFDLETGRLNGTINARATHVRQLAWSPSGKQVVASYATDGALRVFNRGNGELLFEDHFGGPAFGAAVSPQGRIAVSSLDGSVRLYALSESGKVQPEGSIHPPAKDPGTVDFSPDGKLLAVGYQSRMGNGNLQVDVFDALTGKPVTNFQFNDLPTGNLRVVHWQRDGTALYAAGNASREEPVVTAKKIDWPSGRVSELKLGWNSVTGLVSLSGNRLAYATAEPAWGVLAPGGTGVRKDPLTPDLRGPEHLKLDPLGRQVAWHSTIRNAPVAFDVASRTWLDAIPRSLESARTTSRRFSTQSWNNTWHPQLNRQAVPMKPAEISRAVAVMPDDSAVLWGSTRGLRKLDASGKEIWALAMSEVRAIQVSEDSKLIVTASIDGVLRWLDASDGTTLLSFLALRDGRWIAWTEKGYYDASAGGESLIGWQVNRADRLTVDFFPASQFRDRFYRPDVIDRVLTTRSESQALAAANDELRRQTALRQDKELDLAVEARLKASPSARPLALPPVLGLSSAKVVKPDGPNLTVDFTVFTHGPAPVSSWEVKVDGRPATPVSLSAPALADGKAVGRLTLAAPKKNAMVQLFASSAAGVSDPLTVEAQVPSPATGPAPAPPSDADTRPTLYVLAVGVSNYAKPSYSLVFPSKDAADFVNVLKRQEGRFYKKVVVQLLVDQQATRQSVIEGLGWLQRNTGEGDVGMLFVAGHGITDAGNTYRFLPHDADLNVPSRSMVSEEQIRNALVRIRGKALFFVDTCYSGKTGEFTRQDTKLIANKLASPENGVVVFSSSDGRQESLEKRQWNNGAFTGALVAGLRGRADFRREGVVTQKGLDYFVSHEVRKLTEGRQTPVTTVPVGIADFTLTQTLE